MKIDDLAHNWRRWHAIGLTEHLIHLYFPEECGSAESAMKSPHNAGWGNAEMGEADPLLEKVTRPPIDYHQARRFEGAYQALSDRYKRVVRAEYLPWMAFDADIDPKCRSKAVYLNMLQCAKGQLLFKLECGV